MRKSESKKEIDWKSTRRLSKYLTSLSQVWKPRCFYVNRGKKTIESKENGTRWNRFSIDQKHTIVLITRLRNSSDKSRCRNAHRWL